MRTVKFCFLLLAALGVTQIVIAASSSAKMSVDSKLYSSSNLQSSVVANLKQGSDLTIVKRQGGWYQVKAASGQSGWVRSYDVQIDSGGNWFSRLKRVVAGGYSSQSNASATIGIRGLGPGDVKKAAPNPQEVTKLDSYKLTVNDGKQYAASVPLKANQVSYLGTNKAATSSGNNNSNTSNNNQKQNSGGNALDGVGDALKGLF